MRSAALNAHTQLCRACQQLRPASMFYSGDSVCRDCRRIERETGTTADAMKVEALGRPVLFSDLQRREAIAKHATGLDLRLYALWADGGFGAVVFGVQEAVKRLADKKRPEITAEGWIA